jgi:hypothetical protein
MLLNPFNLILPFAALSTGDSDYGGSMERQLIDELGGTDLAPHPPASNNQQ